MDDRPQVQKTPESSQPQYYDPSHNPEKEAYHPPHVGLLSNDTQNGNPGAADTTQRLDRRERVYGMSPIVFGLLVAGITAVIVGAAVGGGLGSALAKARDQKSTATPSISTTTVSVTTTVSSSAFASTTTGGLLVNYKAVPPQNVSSVALDCPNLDNKAYTTITGDIFVMSCTVGYQGDDLSSFVAYAYSDCIEACSNMNYQQGQKVCHKIRFDGQMAINIVESMGLGNCWLKGNDPTTISMTDGLTAQLTS